MQASLPFLEDTHTALELCCSQSETQSSYLLPQHRGGGVRWGGGALKIPKPLSQPTKPKNNDNKMHNNSGR